MEEMVLDNDPLTKYLRDEFTQGYTPGTGDKRAKIEMEQAEAGVKQARDKNQDSGAEFVKDAARANRSGRVLGVTPPKFGSSPTIQ
jgi:hypothetical protein